MDFESSVQAIYYITGKKRKSLDRWAVLKLIFFADRYHLRKYGRTITDDNYYAMQNGPVATTVYDIIKGVIEPNQEKYIKKYLKYVNKNQNITNSKPDLELSHLSETDIEALEFSINTFGKYSSKDLVDIAHKYPEWKKYEDIFNDNQYARINMNLEDFFDDPTVNDLQEKVILNSDPFDIIPKKLVKLTKEAFIGNI